jgi:hypothetical protein
MRESPEIDWTGVQPDRSPLMPLNADTFLVRLRLLNERVNSIRALRAAFEQAHGSRLSPDHQSAARSAR